MFWKKEVRDEKKIINLISKIEQVIEEWKEEL